MEGSLGTMDGIAVLYRCRDRRAVGVGGGEGKRNKARVVVGVPEGLVHTVVTHIRQR